MRIQTSLKATINAFFTKGNARSLAVKKNIAASLLLKCVSILISLQVVPLTIHYINPTRYGLWLTLSSIIAWLSYFDLGFAHGFRNRFAEAKAQGDMKLAREYVSTTYAVLFLLFSVVLCLAIIINRFLDWSQILNIDPIYNVELQTVFGILACFFCLNIVASVFTTMLTADQKPAFASLIQTSGQLLAFICIYILTKTIPGNLVTLAFAFSGIPCFLLVIVSIIVFCCRKYRIVSPSYRYIRFSLTKKILGLGGQFFVIMISMMFIFQFVNIILSRVEGPEAVTQYNIAYKYFNVLNMVVTIVLTPFWSAFTDAYVKKDKIWMLKAQRKLERMWILCIPVALIMLASCNWVYRIWLGTNISIPFSLSIVIMIYILAQMRVAIYVYLINGIGTVFLQAVIYLVFALIALPIMFFSCECWGIHAVLYVPILVYCCQSVVARIQIYKLINGTATGLWNK